MAKQKLSERVKELEADLQEAREEILKLYQETKNDIKEDVSSFGAGDVAIFLAGFLLGGLLVWIF